LTEYCCPICEGKVSKKARDHVLKEMAELALNPDHKLQTYDSKEENDFEHRKILSGEND